MPERERGVADVLGRAAHQAGQQAARLGALQVDLRQRPRHVRDRHPACRRRRGTAAVPLFAAAPLHPALHVAVRRVGGHHHKGVVPAGRVDDRARHGGARGEFAHGEVGLQAAVPVEPLRVRDLAAGAVDVGGGQPVQQRAGASPLHEKLGHEGHVHKHHALAAGPVLGLPVREPGLAPPREGLLGADPGRRERVRRGDAVGVLDVFLAPVPVGAFPPADVFEVRGGPAVAARARELRVERGALVAAGGLERPVGKVQPVDQAERLDHPGGPVRRVALEAVEAVDVESRHVVVVAGA